MQDSSDRPLPLLSISRQLIRSFKEYQEDQVLFMIIAENAIICYQGELTTRDSRAFYLHHIVHWHGTEENGSVMSMTLTFGWLKFLISKSK